MSARLKYLLLFLGFFTKYYGQYKGDSLVLFSDLEFKTDFERNNFKSYVQLGNKTDIIDLFLVNFENKAAASSSKVHERIKDCVTDLQKETEGVNEFKKIKIIYREVHQRFFEKYNLRNSFSDIFEKGEYNCVSGSALYAIILQKMNIPFQIIEAPRHVFLVAYPNTHKILIESTDPNKGYLAVSDVQMNRFVKHLYEAKIISKQEFDNTPATELFNKHYFENKGLSLLELAGIQYSNFVAYHAEDENYEKALTEIKKAFFLIANERNKYLLESATSYVIENSNYSKKSNIHNLCILCRFNNQNKKQISDEKIKYEFNRIIHEQLIDNYNEKELEYSYELINASLSDTSLKNELAFGYHYELARVGLQKQRGKEFEMLHLQKAYAIKPKNTNLQGMILAYSINQLAKLNESETIMKRIKEYTSVFDFLEADPGFNSLKANCLLELCYQKFMLNQINLGETYKSDFEKLADSNSEIKADAEFVEKAYSTAASYYFKKGNKAKTKEILKKGITYAPGNFGLQMRLNQVR